MSILITLLNGLMSLATLYIFASIILLYIWAHEHEWYEFEIRLALWPKNLAIHIGFKEKINLNTVIGICLGIFYLLLYSGNAEEITPFLSVTERYRDEYDRFIQAQQGLGTIYLFTLIGPYLIAVAPGIWVLIGYVMSFMALISIFSF